MQCRQNHEKYLERYLLIRHSKSEWYMGMNIDEGPYKNAGPYASESEAILTYQYRCVFIGARARLNDFIPMYHVL